jgi:allantoicase
MEGVMAKYEVIIPMSAHAIVVVEADDEQAAIEAALNTAFNVTATNGVNLDNIELHQRVGRGNAQYCFQCDRDERRQYLRIRVAVGCDGGIDRRRLTPRTLRFKERRSERLGEPT